MSCRQKAESRQVAAMALVDRIVATVRNNWRESRPLHEAPATGAGGVTWGGLKGSLVFSSAENLSLFVLLMVVDEERQQDTVVR